MKATIKHNITH